MNSTLIDSSILVAVRIGFFLASRKFLLSILNPTLRDLSTPESSLPLFVGDDSDTEAGSYPSSPAPRTDVVELRPRRPTKTINLSHGGANTSAKNETRGLNRAARILFSLCISESCILVTLVMLHAIGLLSLTSRQHNFTTSLYILLALILVILPLKQCLLFTYRTRSSKTPLSIYLRLLIALLPFALYAFLFTRIPPYVTADTEGSGWLAPSLGRVVVLGVIVLGGLSGFGAVRTTWAFYLSSKRSAAADDIAQAERSLHRIRQDLETKQAGQPESTWSKRLFGDGGELAGLVAMEREAARSLEDMRQRRKNHDFAQTVWGRCYNIIGYVFALYCGARVLMCLPSLFWSTSNTTTAKGNTNGDWISFLIAFALSKLPIEVDIEMWSRAISLVFTGLIILSSLAQVLRSLTRVLKLSSKSVGAGFLLLTLGQLFVSLPKTSLRQATYIISLLVQLRTTIPGSPDSKDSLLAFLPDFQVFGRLFDIVFVVTALTTLVYRFIASRLN